MKIYAYEQRNDWIVFNRLTHAMVGRIATTRFHGIALNATKWVNKLKHKRKQPTNLKRRISSFFWEYRATNHVMVYHSKIELKYIFHWKTTKWYEPLFIEHKILFACVEYIKETGRQWRQYDFGYTRNSLMLVTESWSNKNIRKEIIIRGSVVNKASASFLFLFKASIFLFVLLFHRAVFFFCRHAMTFNALNEIIIGFHTLFFGRLAF